jgi:hypothetical protein
MTKAHGHAHPPIRGSTHMLRCFAIGSLFWPVLVIALLYGEWLLATWSLGHIPRPSIDDPKGVAGSSWMHILTLIAIFGAVPAAALALVLNATVISICRLTVLRGLLRIAAVMLSWAVLWALFRLDPGAVLFWWFD